MKKYFYWWSFLDLHHTCDAKKTYFYKSAKEAASNNLYMVHSLALFLMIISMAVIGMSLTFFGAPLLALIYFGVFLLEAAFYGVATIGLKISKNYVYSNILSSVYLFHMLLISSILGTKFSPNESATVFAAVLVISQILFVLPPVLTTGLDVLALAVTFFLSYHVKSNYFFKSDILNCLSIFMLAILLGWRITKVRIEESEARNEAILLSRELESMSLTDQLTTLENHRSFQSTYYKLYNELKDTGEPIGVIMLDIDKFKFYNDNYGHLKGDYCLHAVGECFQQLKSDSVVPFRFGGEEFVVIVTGESCNTIHQIAENIRQKVEALQIPHEFSTAGRVVTISAGYYVGYPQKIILPMQLVDSADQALYMSKKAGGNKVTGA